MTREEDFNYVMRCERIWIDKACEDIREALKQEPCEDAISRQAVIKAIYDNTDRLEIAKSVRGLPPVNPQPKIGHWIRWYEIIENESCTTHDPHCKCSECGKEYDPYISQFIKYCNECGAKMVEPRESEERVMGREEISREEIAALLARESEEQG